MERCDHCFTVYFCINIFFHQFTGTEEERGLVAWRQHLNVSSDQDLYTKESDDIKDVNSCDPSYDIPIFRSCLKKHRGFSWLPVCPSFTGYGCGNWKCKK